MKAAASGSPLARGWIPAFDIGAGEIIRPQCKCLINSFIWNYNSFIWNYNFHGIPLHISPNIILPNDFFHLHTQRLPAYRTTSVTAAQPFRTVRTIAKQHKRCSTWNVATRQRRSCWCEIKEVLLLMAGNERPWSVQCTTGIKAIFFITFELVTSNPGTCRKGNPWKEPACDVKLKIKVFEVGKREEEKKTLQNMTGSKTDGDIPN